MPTIETQKHALEADCRAQIVRCFALLKDPLVHELRRIAQASYPPGCRFLQFEFDSPHFSDGFPVTFYFLDDLGHPQALRRVLPEVACTVPREVMDDARYAADGLDTWVLASEELLPWFADCWHAAGGATGAPSAYLAQHDSTDAYDLTLRCEVAG